MDETSTAKQEVEKCYKRIADLETRIHDLTLQISTVSVYIDVGIFIVTATINFQPSLSWLVNEELCYNDHTCLPRFTSVTASCRVMV